MRLMLLPLLLLAAVSAAFAQNSDLGLMIGISHVVNGFTSSNTTSSVIPAGAQTIQLSTTSSGTVSAGGQINFAIQLHENPHLYLELPLHITGVSSGLATTGGESIGSTLTLFYFTPGIRWNFRPAARVSIYAVAGVGAVIQALSQGVAANGVAIGSSRVSATGAFDYGLGLDFRLTRLVSLRTEGRQVLSIAQINGHHHEEFFTAGVGLHF
jgi:opacity protein-like surface antigen